MSVENEKKFLEISEKTIPKNGFFFKKKLKKFKKNLGKLKKKIHKFDQFQFFVFLLLNFLQKTKKL